MPYKSEAQRRLMHHLVSTGKLAPEVVHEYDRESKGKHLPEYVKRAFGGQVYAKDGIRCPACDFPLDQVPVALDAGEGCPRCGYGDAKDVPRKAQGGEVMEPTAYRAHGGEMYVPLKARGGEIKTNNAEDFLSTLRMSVGKMRLEAEKRKREAERTSPDASIPNSYYWEQGGRQEEWAKNPAYRTPENARLIQRAAEREARNRPEYAELWRKATSGRMGDLKMADQYAHGGEICPTCNQAFGSEAAQPIMKELYPRKKERGADLDNGFIIALKRRRG